MPPGGAVERSEALDSRLTEFDLPERRAAPAGRLIDPHTHYTGDPAELEGFARLLAGYAVECVFMILPRGAGADELHEVMRVFDGGETAVIPYAWIEMDSGGADDVQRAFDAGFWGVKFIGPLRPYDDRHYDPVYSRAADLRMPALFHTGVLKKSFVGDDRGMGMSLMRADMLDTLASRFPDLLA